MTEIVFEASALRVTESDLADFFVGWPTPPSPARRLNVLRSAHEVVVARDGDGRMVGFITAITDGMFAAYIPLLEVLPNHQRQGIGRRLLETMTARLASCYMIDLVCDDDVAGFYERCGSTRVGAAVVWRNYERL